jgi:hypothetical protein
MTTAVGWLRRQLAGFVAIVVVVGLFTAARLPAASAAESAALARDFAFQPEAIASVGGYPQQTIRKVNQDYKKIDAWISSVGAGVAINDLDGDGLPNDICVTDPRIDQVVVSPAPGAGADRYPPFVLDPEPLPTNHAVAPMGCAPGDFNEDGRLDVLVYYWGRTPIIFLARADATQLSGAAYVPTELAPGHRGDQYAGPQWNTNAVAVDDFDGDGHVDIYVGNYFPHSPVLDHTVGGGVAMNDSLSNAANGGEDYIFRWTGATAGADPTVTFECVEDALPEDLSKGWVLAAAANDIDGDLLPELYLGQDHGKDAMLHNRSVPGAIRFTPTYGDRSADLPKSKRMGADSFKGMAAEWADLDGDGLYDVFVSNITTPFGIQESNFHFINTAADQADLRRQLRRGDAPFSDRSTAVGTAWSGWAWDVKTGDFGNTGRLAIAQATGFVRGEVNRWPQLQELATANDLVVQYEKWWPNVEAGDDLAGSQRLMFFVPRDDGTYVNLAKQLGLDVPVPTRGLATADTDADGRLDLAVARQWDEPIFYRNTAPEPGAFLGLRLVHEGSVQAAGAATGPAPGSPAVGAQAMVTTADGRTFVGRVDGGSGHSGKRSTDVHIGLGEGVTGPVEVRLCWRDRTGQVREDTMSLTPGWHTVQLGARAQER